MAKATRGRPGADEPGRERVGAGLEVPDRGDDVGRPEGVAGTAENPHGSARRQRRASALVRTMAQPPSDVVAQSRRWNGSAIMREARMSAGVNGPRPA